MATGNNPWPNCTTNCSVQGFQIGIPPNLAVHDPSHPVPVVIDFPDGSMRPYGSFNNTGIDGPDEWDYYAAQDKLMVVQMFPDPGSTGTGIYGGWGNTVAGQFQSTPILFGTTSVCGTGNCDDGVLFHSIINYLEANYSIDPNWIIAGGGSKGGSEAEELVCDPTVEPLISGMFLSSVYMPSTGTNATNGVPGNSGTGGGTNVAGSCPGILAQPESQTPYDGISTAYTPNPSAKPIMILHQFSWMDATQNRTCNASSVGWSELPPYAGLTPTGLSPTAWGCFAGGAGVTGFTGWTYLPPDLLRRVYAPAFGCSVTPISTVGVSGGGTIDWQNPASVVSGTPRMLQQTYQCGGNIRIALWAMGNINAGSGCHAYSCPVPGETYETGAIFNYFETGTPTAS